MIKTFNINLAGQIFNINEDAFEHLSNYFNTLRSFYANEEDKDEIIRDIEARFAELFLAKGKSYIITKQDAEEVVNLMGNPQEFDEDNQQQASQSSTANTASSSTAIPSGKKLYRDMDNSVVAGVCAGLSNYLGISDPIWIRLTFILLAIFTATFWMFVIYPILWFIIPEAITSAQKLEMKGEAINLSNIEKKIKDESAPEKPKGILNQMIAFLGAGVLVFFKFLLWLGIAIAILTGGALVFSLLVVLIVLAVITVVGIPFVNNFFYNSSADGWMLGIGGLLVGIIPVVFGILALVHVFSKTSKPLKKQFIFPLVGLFLFGFLLLNISGYHAKQLVSEKRKINQTLPLNYDYKSDTLQITMNPSIKDEDYSDININGVTGLIDFISDFDDKLVPVNIEIFTSENDSFYVVRQFSASGKDDKDAIENATNFKHNISQVNNKIIIDPYIQFNADKVKYRNQRLLIKVYVPEGKIIKWDRRTEEYIDLNKIEINFDAGASISTPVAPGAPVPPVPPVPPMPGKHKIKISKKTDSSSSQVVINIDSDEQDINAAIGEAQEKLDRALDKLEDVDPDINIDVNIDSKNDFYSRQHYIFRMVNGELVPID